MAATPSLWLAATVSTLVALVLGGLWLALRPRARVVAAAGDRVAIVAAIGTANPPHLTTGANFERVCAHLDYPAEVLKTITKVVKGSAIETRRTCVSSDDPAAFVALLEAPGGRAKLWEEWAPRLAVQAARDALSRWRHGTAADITHVVVHSCTGFAAPGLDFHLIQQLGLPATTRKLGVNFMGCFGGFTALYVAKQIVEADPLGRAAVLIACAETCSAHLSRDPRVELIVGNTLFADGAASAVVTRSGFRGMAHANVPITPAEVAGEWIVGDMGSDIVPNSAGAMTWKTGAVVGQYDMWLDRSIPTALASMFATSGLSLLSRVGVPSAWSCAWAIHPGGKAILKAFEGAFTTMRIKGDGLSHSYDVLREHGNMSSATIFFVLQRVLAATDKNDVFCAGFGPGLTIEYGRVYRRGMAGVNSGAGAGAAGTTAPAVQSRPLGSSPLGAPVADPVPPVAGEGVERGVVTPPASDADSPTSMSLTSSGEDA